MNKKSNVITNIVVILFIILGAIGFSLVISEYSDVMDNDVASRNYLQQSSTKMHELETDLCIALNLGRNADAASASVEEYLDKMSPHVDVDTKRHESSVDYIEKKNDESHSGCGYYYRTHIKQSGEDECSFPHALVVTSLQKVKADDGTHDHICRIKGRLEREAVASV